MEKLNELAEQAKFVADWHGSDWSSALCQDKDGKQAHEIICESRGEAVISTGSNSNEASWLCDYLELCSPENILAIAAAFRALGQEKEAADRYAERLNTLLDDRDATLSRYEAKLAELEKQKPVGTVSIAMDWNTHRNVATVNMRHDLVVSEMKDGDELFTRPAPAADLVPGEWTNEQCLEFLSIAFRHAEISGDIEMNDIRLAVKMVNAAAPEVE
ncbi:hypothetical protein [Pantoea agglomerans]|uniref:hypothetical protein n=1 Tax=Enterobacter agglomerans TaxID=549 RepID=UPI0037C569C5